MERDTFDRRSVLRGVTGVLAAGVLAGCSGGSGGGGSNDGGSGGGAGNETGAGNGGSGGGTGTEAGTTGGAQSTETQSTDTGTTGSETGNESTTGDGTGGTSAQVDQYLSEAKGYDGSIADMTGTDTVEIAVGAGENGYAFDPAAVRVSPGTTIRWAWTGEGGAHNVVSQNGPLDSGQPEMGENVTYEETLDQSGTYLYYCEPHRTLGMKGAVVVSG